MAVLHHDSRSRDYWVRNNVSGGYLRVPKTPVEKIMLGAKLMKMKRDFLRRQAERGS
jgi:hypothetical protein